MSGSQHPAIAQGDRLAFSGQSIAGQARAHLGNNYNNYSYNYTVRKRRSDETLRDKDRDDTLLKAAAEGQLPRVKHLLHLGADVDHIDDDGYTALHHAVLSGFEDVVRALLEAGADINAQSYRLGSPLCLASLKGRENIINVLLEYRANVNLAGRACGTPLHCVVYAQQMPSIARTLIDHGGNVEDTRDINRWFISEFGIDIASVKQHRPIVRCPPLALAALESREDLIELFLSVNAAVNDSSGGGSTALQYATEKGDMNCVRMLCDAGGFLRSAQQIADGPTTATGSSSIPSNDIDVLGPKQDVSADAPYNSSSMSRPNAEDTHGEATIECSSAIASAEGGTHTQSPWSFEKHKVLRELIDDISSSVADEEDDSASRGPDDDDNASRGGDEDDDASRGGDERLARNSGLKVAQASPAVKPNARPQALYAARERLIMLALRDALFDNFFDILRPGSWTHYGIYLVRCQGVLGIGINPKIWREEAHTCGAKVQSLCRVARGFTLSQLKQLLKIVRSELGLNDNLNVAPCCGAQSERDVVWTRMGEVIVTQVLIFWECILTEKHNGKNEYAIKATWDAIRDKSLPTIDDVDQRAQAWSELFELGLPVVDIDP